MTTIGTRARIRSLTLPRVPRPTLDLFYALLLVAAGAVIALAILKAKPDFWYDEAMLVQALRADGWLPPGVPMSQYEQASPYGAYVVQKALVSVFGFRENVLRLPEMLCLIAAGLTTQWGARTRLRPSAAFFAGLIVITSGVAVRQAGQFKHYEFELLAAAAVLATTLRLLDPAAGRRRVAVWLAVAATAMIFSNSAVLVFAGCTATMLGVRLLAPGRPVVRLRVILAGSVGVLAFFAAWYLVVLRPAFRYQLAYPTYSGPQTLPAFRDLVGLLPVPSGTYESAFWLFVLVGGVVCGLRRRDLLPLVGGSAVVVALAGAGAISGAIPFAADRHLLFLVPCIALIAACGGEALAGLPFRSALPLPASLLRGQPPLESLLPGAGAASRSGFHRARLTAAAGAVVACYAAWAAVPATTGNGTATQQAVGYALTSSADRCGQWWVDWWAQPAAQLYADRAGLSDRVLGTVSTVSGMGQDSWAYRLRDQPAAWQRAMVRQFQTRPGTCLLIGSREDERPLAIDPLLGAGLQCDRFAQMQDAELWSCPPAHSSPSRGS